jgi:hypothetical protein
MSKIKLDDIVPASGSIINIPGNLNVTGDITSSGTSTLGNTVVGGGTTELIVNGDARITGILTVGTSSLTIDGNAGTINGIPYASTGPLSNRNLIINGGMKVSQRETSVTAITGAGYFTVDRFKTGANALGTWTVAQESDAPVGFSKSLKMTCTTADASPAAGDSVTINQRIEAQDLQHLNYGSSSAETLTLSFWVKSNKTGTATVDFQQNDNGNELYSVGYTINAADTWEYKTITIPGDTAGVINDDNGIGIVVSWWLNSGSDYTGGSHGGWKTFDSTSRNVSNLGVGGAISDYFQITGVQLELGSVATPFEHRSFGDELKRCERYYEKSFTYVSPPGTATSNGALSHRKTSNTTSYTGFQIRFGTRKRATPTIGLYNTNNSTEGEIRSDGANVAADDLNTNEMGFNVNTVPTQGANVIQSMHYTADAEL